MGGSGSADNGHQSPSSSDEHAEIRGGSAQHLPVARKAWVNGRQYGVIRATGRLSQYSESDFGRLPNGRTRPHRHLRRREPSIFRSVQAASVRAAAAGLRYEQSGEDELCSPVECEGNLVAGVGEKVCRPDASGRDASRRDARKY